MYAEIYFQTTQLYFGRFWLFDVSNFHPLMRRVAFHILLEFLPARIKIHQMANRYLLVKKSIPTLTPSAPYFSISSIGSGEFPSDLDIFLPSYHVQFRSDKHF